MTFFCSHSGSTQGHLTEDLCTGLHRRKFLSTHNFILTRIREFAFAKRNNAELCLRMHFSGCFVSRNAEMQLVGTFICPRFPSNLMHQFGALHKKSSYNEYHNYFISLFLLQWFVGWTHWIGKNRHRDIQAQTNTFMQTRRRPNMQIWVKFQSSRFAKLNCESTWKQNILLKFIQIRWNQLKHCCSIVHILQLASDLCNDPITVTEKAPIVPTPLIHFPTCSDLGAVCWPSEKNDEMFTWSQAGSHQSHLITAFASPPCSRYELGTSRWNVLHTFVPRTAYIAAVKVKLENGKIHDSGRIKVTSCSA